MITSVFHDIAANVHVCYMDLLLSDCNGSLEACQQNNRLWTSPQACSAPLQLCRVLEPVPTPMGQRTENRVMMHCGAATVPCCH